MYGGAQPEGATTFAAMKEYGINTLISVARARPEVEFSKLKVSKQMSEVFMAMMNASVYAAKQLETQLRDDIGAHGLLNARWDALAKSCKTCHAQFRNTPQ